METSLLNRLPAELRTQIYEHVFTFDSVRCQDGRWRVYEKRKTHPQRSGLAAYHLRAFRLATRLGPTLVCKQMRAETLHLLMTLNEPVCGNERGDVDPYYEFWMGPRLLKEPCVWASRALDQGRSPFLTASTVFRLHLWVYPCMRDSMGIGDWREFEKTFTRLVDGSCPGKVIVSLHFIINDQPLACEYKQQEGADVADSQFEYGVFEIELNGRGMENKGHVRLFGEKREVLKAHEGHEGGLCNVTALALGGRLSEQLRQTEEMAVVVVQMAQAKRVEGLSLAGSVHS